MSGKEKVSKKKKVAKVATFMSGMVHREKISLHINLLFWIQSNDIEFNIHELLRKLHVYKLYKNFFYETGLAMAGRIWFIRLSQLPKALN